jgi:hypothetical protein
LTAYAQGRRAHSAMGGSPPPGRSRTAQNRPAQHRPRRSAPGRRAACTRPWAPRQAVRRDAVKRARERKVRALRPATATFREGTHCVTPPVVSGASRPDNREATHEQGPCNDPARDLWRNHQRLALTRGHGGNGIEGQVRAAAERAILGSQQANAEFAAAAKNAIVHPYVFQSFSPKESVTTPRPAKTMPPPCWAGHQCSRQPWSG